MKEIKKVSASRKASPPRDSYSRDFDAISWMSAHQDEMRMYCGKWVALKLPDGIVASGDSLETVLGEWRQKYPGVTPFVFMVPHEYEGAFVP